MLEYYILPKPSKFQHYRDPLFFYRIFAGQCPLKTIKGSDLSEEVLKTKTNNEIDSLEEQVEGDPVGLKILMFKNNLKKDKKKNYA